MFKKSIAVILFLFVIFNFSFAYGQFSPTLGGCNIDGFQSAAETAQSEVANAVFDDFLPSAEDAKNEFRNCFGDIMNVNAGFSLGIPSIGDILGSACDIALDLVGDNIGDLNAHYNIELFDEFTSSTSFLESESISTDTGMSSDEIATGIWDRINQPD